MKSDKEGASKWHYLFQKLTPRKLKHFMTFILSIVLYSSSKAWEPGIDIVIYNYSLFPVGFVYMFADGNCSLKYETTLIVYLCLAVWKKSKKYINKSEPKKDLKTLTQEKILRLFETLILLINNN